MDTLNRSADAAHDHDVCEHADATTTHAPAVLLHDAELIGLTEDDLVADPFWTTKLEVAIGANRQEKNWRTLPQTRGELVASLTEFMRGEKDGLCITQGPLINGQRIAKNVIANHIVMLDCDTGEPLDSLLSKVKALGTAAVVWTTHSHMKPQTTIAEDRLVKLARDAKAPMPADQDGLIELARQYLGSKKYAVGILDSINAVDREHGEGGIKFVVRHAPMARARVLLFLSAPYVFATAKATQAQAIADWKEAYAGVAEMLGVDYDQSCVDPSRLMYTPRIAPDASGRAPYELGHEIIVLAGKALDLDAVPRVGKTTKAQVAGDANSRSGALRTPDIFRAVKYPDLDIVGLCNTYASEDIRSDTGDKLELVCPNEDRHTEQKEDDRAFMVRSDGEVWWAGCQHATCKADSAEDRLWYLDKLCEKYGISTDAVLTYSPTAVAEIEARAEAEANAQQAQVEAGDAFEAALVAIAELKAVDGDVIANACDMIVSKYPDDRTRQDGDAIRLTRVVAGWDKKQIGSAMASARKRAKDKAEAEAPQDTGPDVNALGAYNDQFAIVRQGQDVRVAIFPDNAAEPIEFMKTGAFHIWKAPDGISHDWETWHDRRTYDGITFDPSKIDAGGNKLNLWRGFGVTPVPGDWSLLRRHIFENMCHGNPYWFAYTMNWLAVMIQRPTERYGVAVVVRGDKGTGKSKITDWTRLLMPENSCTLSKPEHVTGRFNAHQARSLFTIIEEAVWAGAHDAERALKHMITAPTQFIEPKGVDALEVPNYQHFWMNANPGWVVPASGDERRFFVLDISAARRLDFEYFAAIDEQMEAGGLAAMMYDLTHMRLVDWIELRDAPRTPWLADQQAHSMPSEAKWLQSVLDDGGFTQKQRSFYWSLEGVEHIVSDKADTLIAALNLDAGTCATVADGTGVLYVPKDDVRAAYMDYCRGTHLKPMPENMLGAYLSKMGVKERRLTRRTEVIRLYAFPALGDFRKAFTEKHGVRFGDTGDTYAEMVPDDVRRVAGDELAIWQAYGDGGTLPA